MRRTHVLWAVLLCLALAVLTLDSVAVAEPTAEKILYSFQNTSGDGNTPRAGMIADTAGNLYGTTFAGGLDGAGAVFELSPPQSKTGSWKETVLYSFSYANLQNGLGPWAGLAMDATGNLYGTTWLGGQSGAGEVFELSPPAVVGGAWTLNVLYSFTGLTDGLSPEAGLVFDTAGNLYGTTVSGGTGGCIGGCGVVFELAPPATQGGAWTESVLYNFRGTSTGGGGTAAGLAIDSVGKLYGTTFNDGNAGLGTVFQLVPPATPGGAWTRNFLYAFRGGKDGAFPQGGVIFDTAGNLYGTTQSGGKGSCDSETCGTFFQLKPTSQGPWKETVLYRFAGGADGGFPGGNLVIDATGTLYGTTTLGGNAAACSPSGCGISYRMEPGPVGNGWTETVLHVFNAGSDGATPTGGLVLGRFGQLLGTTSLGGTGTCVGGCGTIFTNTK